MPSLCQKRLGPDDSMIIGNPWGRIIFKHKEISKRIPASTLKLLTALTAINHLGLEYRFKTEFYLDSGRNLIIKGYGDPLLISEVWKEIAESLTGRLKECNNIVLDVSYFSKNIIIPGRSLSTNPYDAPVGALCANFNTVFYRTGDNGRIISAEPQTPMIPFARKKIATLGIRQGRYTFSHDSGDAARYAGELLLHFLREKGLAKKSKVLFGEIRENDRLLYTYYSKFSLAEILQKMLEFSNNFIANQIVIALGAGHFGPPGTLKKGVRIISDFAEVKLGMTGIDLVEGSGISRSNRVSALDMMKLLVGFKPYRHLLKREGCFLFKTGSLRGIRTRAGFIDRGDKGIYCFAVFLNRAGPDMDMLMECIDRLTDKGI